MALYPQTTCFYKAVVNQLPTSSTEEYEVLFEDPTYPDGFSPPLTVAQRYVISIKDKKGKSQSWQPASVTDVVTLPSASTEWMDRWNQMLSHYLQLQQSEWTDEIKIVEY
jgi:SGF29 tudor-like domain.